MALVIGKVDAVWAALKNTGSLRRGNHATSPNGSVEFFNYVTASSPAMRASNCSATAVWDPSQPTLIDLPPCSSPRKGTPVMNRPMCRIVVSAVGAAALLGFAGVGAGAAPRRVTEVLLPTRRQASSSNVHDSISSSGVHSRRTSTPVAQIPPMVAAPYDLARTPYFGAGVSYGSAWPSRHGTSLSSARPAHHRRLISRSTSTAIHLRSVSAARAPNSRIRCFAILGIRPGPIGAYDALGPTHHRVVGRLARVDVEPVERSAKIC
jgi:hypothetical protein